MLPGFLLSLREGLEAALVIGIVLGVLAKLKRTDLNRIVWSGLALAIVLSAVIAGILSFFRMEFEGQGEMIFEGSTLLLAAGLLTWMIVWMRLSARNLKFEIETKTNKIMAKSSSTGLFVLAFLAVFREGVELALFLLAVEEVSSPLQTLAGAILGLISSAFLGWMLFTSSRKMSLHIFFNVTNFLLVFFAAGMVASGIREFIEVGVLPTFVDTVWDITGFVSNNSELGMMLKMLIGYNGRPSLSELLGYSIYMLAIFTFFFARKQKFAAPVRGAAN